MQRIKKGDQVEVLSGDDKGMRGEVNRVIPAKNRVVVHGVNLVKKHQGRASGVRTQTGIIEFEAPMNLSNVAPVCRSCNEWTRVAIETVGGLKNRKCKRCGASLD